MMIVVFGGAFNPPTLAHKEIYQLIIKSLPVEKFIFLPVSKKYSKSSLIADNHRLNMLKILIKDLDKAKISKLETEENQFLGTYKSLKRLQKEYENKKVAFVLGADNLIHLHKWINAEKLIKDFNFIVVNRNNRDVYKLLEKNELLSKYKDNFIVLEEFNSFISSSLFRETLDPSYVDEDIYHYIMKNDLYRGGNNE
ncbi:MAG: nicotinate (nicotinamide) nucleotide adenylyltransferase [Candidatus Izemoplasmatales bacterium]